jgi:hypothetical protein
VGSLAESILLVAEYLQNVKEALNKVEALGYDAEELER